MNTIRLLCLLGVVISVPMPARGTGDTSNEFDASMSRGRAACDKKDFSQAIKDFDRAIQINPKSALAYSNRGFAQSFRNHDKAVADFTEAMRLDPRDPLVYFLRAREYAELGRARKALTDCDQAATLGFQCAELFLLRGYIHCVFEESCEALADYGEAIKADPKNDMAYYARGLQHRSMNEIDLALAGYSTALKVNPQNVKAHLARADIYDERRNYGKVIEEYSEVIRLNPKDDSMYARRAEAKTAMRDYTGAIADYTIAIGLNCKTVDCVSRRAEAYLAMKDYVNALRDYELLARQFPCGGANDLAWLLATCPSDTIRDAKKAIRHAQTACRLSRWKSAAYIDTLAAAYAEAGQFDEAVHWQRKALAMTDYSKDDMRAGKARLGLYEAHKPCRGGQPATYSPPGPYPSPSFDALKAADKREKAKQPAWSIPEPEF